MADENALTKILPAIQQNVAGASASGTGDSLATNASMAENANAYDEGTRTNNAQLTNLASKAAASEAENAALKAELAAAAKKEENGEDSLLGRGNQEKAMTEASKPAAQIDDSIEKERQAQLDASTKNYSDTIEQSFAEIDNLNTEKAAADAQDIQNDITSHDITTEQGRKEIENYLKTYEAMLKDSKAAWSKNYNRALMFSAFQNGLASAFGVPPIDFTQHPDVKMAEAQLNDMKAFLKEEKATAGKLTQQALETKLANRATQVADKKQKEQRKVDLAKQLNDSNLQARDSARAARDMTNTNLKKVQADLYNDAQYMSAKDELAKREAWRNKQTGYANLGQAGLYEGVKFLPDLIKTAASAAGGK